MQGIRCVCQSFASRCICDRPIQMRFRHGRSSREILDGMGLRLGIWWRARLGCRLLGIVLWRAVFLRQWFYNLG